MNSNDVYRRKFGLHTEHMRRALADLKDDWLVQRANLSGELDEDDAIVELLEYCKPQRVGGRLRAVGFLSALLNSCCWSTSSTGGRRGSVNGNGRSGDGVSKTPSPPPAAAAAKK
jgi:hypothetical protein